MNNNDILNKLQSSGEDCTPSKRLDPLAIEESLSGVKRKKSNVVTGITACLAVVCLTITSLFSSTIFIKITEPSTEENTYGEIYEIVNTIKKENQSHINFFDVFDENIYYSDVAESTNETATWGASDYSETNVQVDGVDEADVVKTDGKYIYSLCEDSISIALANNGSPEYISEIYIGQAPTEMYLSNDKLIVIVDYYNLPVKETIDTAIVEDMPNEYFTAVLVYDLSDIYSPKIISTLNQSGCYISSRKIGDVLYLTTNYYINYYDEIEKDKPQTYCPIYGNNEAFSCVASDCIIISENTDSAEYLTVSAVDLNNPTDFADMCSVFGGGSEMYSSQENLYVASSFYEDNKYNTQLLRFSLDGANITPNGSTAVSGSVLNQFSMDEYNGYFRIVTETETYYNYEYESTLESNIQTALYVYDNDLNLVGKTEDVANGEFVKSVRFDGDIAYFVTFRQTDPLFTVDLSDPASPQILSELKIPGFSEYLHVFGDGLLLGFGREADETTGSQEGLKLTMFDTSDKTNVTEIATRIITSKYSYSQAEYNHKAIFADEDKGLIGIPYSDYYTENGDSYFYAVYEYDKENEDFVLRTEITLSSDDFNQYYGNYYSRGLYIGDYFYVVTTNTIYAYDYQTFEQTGTASR